MGEQLWGKGDSDYGLQINSSSLSTASLASSITTLPFLRSASMNFEEWPRGRMGTAMRRH